MGELIEAPEVTAVDTTAAGDAFNGALAVALSEDNTMKKAVLFACHASALAVTKLGAQSSTLQRKEVDGFIHSNKDKPQLTANA